MYTAVVIIPTGYAHIQHRFTGSGLPRGAAVTYGIKLNGGSWDPGDAGLLHGHFADDIMPFLTNDVTLTETLMKAGPNEDGPFTVFSDPTVGGIDATSFPPNTAILVEKRTALGGRKNRGRMYLPGVSEGLYDDAGDMGATSAGTWNTRLATWLASIESEVLQMVILHNDSSTPTVVTSLQVDQVAATQRRRLRR